jgi:hypothetical protein
MNAARGSSYAAGELLDLAVDTAENLAIAVCEWFTRVRVRGGGGGGGPLAASGGRSTGAGTGISTAADVQGRLSQLPAGNSPRVKTAPDNAAVRRLFEELTCNARRDPSPKDRPDIEVRVLPDGTRVNFRPNTRSGGDGIDITYPDGGTNRIHTP